MTDHFPFDIWQERGGEFSYRCSCGMHMKHQRFGSWPTCLGADEAPATQAPSVDAMTAP